MLTVVVLVPTLLAPAGCSGSDGPATPASPEAGDAQTPSEGGGSATDLTGALGARGLAVGKGSFEFLDLSQCCSTSCLGNNPSSPYGALFVPAAPGQPAAADRPDGLSSTFRLRADEAIVFVGSTPPEVKYFGFTPYVADRAKDGGGRRLVAASVSEPGEAVFGKRTAVIAAADRRTVEAVTDSLKLGTITFRTYLEPSTKTAPDPTTLVRDRVLRLRR